MKTLFVLAGMLWTLPSFAEYARQPCIKCCEQIKGTPLWCGCCVRAENSSSNGNIIEAIASKNSTRKCMSIESIESLQVKKVSV